jgi:tetratricopeptide (TPR) repeat protein
MSFKQAELWEAVQRPREISSETVEQMEEVVKRYPYFQLVHTLIAKAKHDQQTPDAYGALGRAAIYAPDRRLLRRVFYDELTVVLPNSETEARPPDLAAVVAVTDSDESLPTNLDEVTSTKQSPDPVAEEAVTPVAEESVSDQTFEEKEGESLREELAKTLKDLRARKGQAAESQAVDERPDAEEVSRTDVPGTDVPGTDVPRTRQQEIIDRFVAANPQITRDTSATNENAPDLSASSSAFQDDLVTENLAEIMLKQGKIDKAVSIYEKLMVKYPEKKAYFAQKIEQLKNK